MINEIPYIARMIVFNEIIVCEDKQVKKANDYSYYNSDYDSSSEYCQNTTAWD